MPGPCATAAPRPANLTGGVRAAWTRLHAASEQFAVALAQARAQPLDVAPSWRPLVMGMRPCAPPGCMCLGRRCRPMPMPSGTPAGALDAPAARSPPCAPAFNDAVRRRTTRRSASSGIADGAVCSGFGPPALSRAWRKTADGRIARPGLCRCGVSCRRRRRDVSLPCEADRSLWPVLDQVDAPLRPGAQALSFHALRWLGRGRALLRGQRGAPPPAVDALLSSAVWRWYSRPMGRRTAFTLVDQAVRPQARPRAASARRVHQRLSAPLSCASAALTAAVLRDPVARWNHPRWWVERLRRDHPDTGRPSCRRPSQPRRRWIWRVNPRRASVADCAPAWRSRARVFGRSVARICGVAARARRCRTFRLRGRRVSVQSAPRQRAAPCCWKAAPTSPRLACWTPAPHRGKTAHFAGAARRRPCHRAGHRRPRCERIGNPGAPGTARRCARGGRCGRSRGGGTARFDAILLDAPAKRLGIVRRHPDVALAAARIRHRPRRPAGLAAAMAVACFSNRARGCCTAPARCSPGGARTHRSFLARTPMPSFTPAIIAHPAAAGDGRADNQPVKTTVFYACCETCRLD